MVGIPIDHGDPAAFSLLFPERKGRFEPSETAAYYDDVRGHCLPSLDMFVF